MEIHVVQDTWGCWQLRLVWWSSDRHTRYSYLLGNDSLPEREIALESARDVRLALEDFYADGTGDIDILDEDGENIDWPKPGDEDWKDCEDDDEG